MANVAWDSFGLLLVTADESGQELHVYNAGVLSVIEFCLSLSPILPYPLARTTAEPLVPQQLYTLHRGITTAVFQSLIFSADSRWLAATSARGTAHIFAIHPKYAGLNSVASPRDNIFLFPSSSGGEVTSDTHTSTTVTNLSRFLLSSGAADLKDAAVAPPIMLQAKVRCALLSPLHFS